MRTNGFFLQTPDAGVDGDPATSEGILVFTSSAPPASAVVGNSVQVTGAVTEFTSTGNPAIFIVNSDFLNGILYNATFGTTASFLVDFTGAAFTGTGQSILTTLSVSLTGTSSGVVAQADLVGGSQLDTSFSSQGSLFSQRCPSLPRLG